MSVRMNWGSVFGVAMAAGVIGAFAWSEAIARPKASTERIRITYWEKWTDFEGEAMRAVVDAFNAKQDRIFVDLLTVSGIQDKTLMAISAGTPPDVAGLFGPNVAQYVDDNAIIPLDKYCEEYGLTRDHYIPIYWDIGYYRNHIYALPSTPASTALHYNKRLLREAGFDPNRPPETIEELDAMAEKITVRDANGRFIRSGFLPSEPGWWNWGWLMVFGGQHWDGVDRITVTSPEAIRAYEWVQSYSKKYGVTEQQQFRQGFGNFSSPQNAFLSEKVAMVLQGVWMYNFIDKFAPELEWAAAPFPYPADRPDLRNSTFCDMDVLVIPRGAKHPNEAFEFIAFVQSQEGMELLCMGQRKHSPLAKVSDEFIRNHPNPYIQLFTDLAKSPSAVRPPQIGIWPEFQAELSNAYDQVNLMQKTPQEAMDYLQGRMQPKLDRYLGNLRARGVIE